MSHFKIWSNLGTFPTIRKYAITQKSVEHASQYVWNEQQCFFNMVTEIPSFPVAFRLWMDLKYWVLPDIRMIIYCAVWIGWSQLPIGSIGALCWPPFLGNHKTGWRLWALPNFVYFLMLISSTTRLNAQVCDIHILVAWDYLYINICV